MVVKSNSMECCFVPCALCLVCGAYSRETIESLIGVRAAAGGGLGGGGRGGNSQRPAHFPSSCPRLPACPPAFSYMPSTCKILRLHFFVSVHSLSIGAVVGAAAG